VAFSQDFLDELKARLPVSEVVGRTVQLKREGKEWTGLSPFNQEKTPSFKVNDEKGFYHDFSSGKHGSIFDFVMETEGRTFPEAVEICASIAGVALPNGSGSHASARPASAPAKQEQKSEAKKPAPKRTITATYDYADAQGELLYQVVRLEWEEDGERKKTFFQRRPDPQNAGQWINNLQGIDHGLYRLPELREAGVDDIVWMPEGEKDVETLVGWGEVATTNSGGAKNWRGELAETFAGRDVVILIDNDDPGRQRGQAIAASLIGIAKRVRVLDLVASGLWPEAPEKADVTDWRRVREGSIEELREIVAKLPEVKPPPFQPKFKGVRFEHLDIQTGPRYNYIVDDWFTEGGKALIGGASLSGKSFLAVHTACCVATGIDWFGNKILSPGLVIYQAGEGESGIRMRFKAWRNEHGLKAGAAVPIYIVEQKIDIFNANADTQPFIDEIRAISKTYSVPLRQIFIDTLAKASIGADENSGKDMGIVMANIDKIADAFPQANVCLVHHMNAGGTKLRGHTSVYAGADQVVLVAKNDDGRTSTATLDKQKDGESGIKFGFDLLVREVGFRELDGKPITSCVVVPSRNSAEARGTGAKKDRTLVLSDQNNLILASLKEALEAHGEPPPPQLGLPRSIAKVTTAKHWRAAFEARTSLDNPAAINAAMKRASDRLIGVRAIGRINPWVWVTDRFVAVAPIKMEGDVDAGPPPQDEIDFSTR
jgi:hypothetical protein